MRKILSITITALVFAVFATSAFASVEDQLTQVLKRLEALEKENAELKKIVNDMKAKGTAPEKAVVSGTPNLAKKKKGTGLNVSATYLAAFRVNDSGTNVVLDSSQEEDDEVEYYKGEIQGPDTKNESAYRIELAYNFDSGSDVTLRYFAFNTSSDETVENEDYYSYLTEPHAEYYDFYDFNNVVGKVEYDFRVFDLEMGQKFQLTPSVETRLSAGLRFADYQRKLTQFAYNNDDDYYSNVVSQQDFAGIGLVFGSSAKIDTFGGIYLTGGAKYAAVYGKYDASYQDYWFDETDLDTIVDTRFTDQRIIQSIEASVGLGWGMEFGAMAFNIEGGYELTNYMGFDQITYPDDVLETKDMNEDVKLSTNGFYLKAVLEF